MTRLPSFLHLDLGTDFSLPTPAQVTFLDANNPASGSVQCLPVTIIDDDDYEGDHSFMVAFGALSVSPTLATTTGPSAQVTIQDNDGIHIIIHVSFVAVAGIYMYVHVYIASV